MAQSINSYGKSKVNTKRQAKKNSNIDFFFRCWKIESGNTTWKNSSAQMSSFESIHYQNNKTTWLEQNNFLLI